jgi:hypothetical protein
MNNKFFITNVSNNLITKLMSMNYSNITCSVLDIDSSADCLSVNIDDKTIELVHTYMQSNEHKSVTEDELLSIITSNS